MLATVPSHVFLGERCGANACFPMERPTKYAVVSPAQVRTRANSSNFGPSSRRPCNRTPYDNGNATSKKALDDIPAAGRASTIGRRVHKMKTIKPKTKRKKMAPTEYIAERLLIPGVKSGRIPPVTLTGLRAR